MFNVDTRTTLTLARLHQDELTATFPRKRRMLRRDSRRSAPEAPRLADAGALPVPPPLQVQPEAGGV